MTEIPGIPYHPEFLPSMDYALLRRQGIQYVQQLAGKIWTDYNDHDPGVTILEQLSFALTQIGYKTNLDIRKLLFSGGDEEAMAAANGIYPAHEIFMTGCVTAHDFSVMLLNTLKKDKVYNVWLRPAKDSTTQGLYDIYVRTDTPPEEHEALRQKISAVYAQHRALGEDLRNVVILEPEYIDLTLTVDINDDVTPERLVAALFFKADAFFNPRFENASFQELVAAGLGYEDIFNITAFQHGFIRPWQHRETGGMYSLSALIGALATIPGIRTMKHLTVQKDGIKVTGKYLTIEEGYVPEIRITPDAPGITIYRNYNRVNYDGYLVKRYYREMVAQGNTSYPFTPPVREKLPVQTHRQIGKYASVQHTFPITYGIGRYGLPGDASKERIRQARQLQSYLLLFDQFMMNHLAQLSNLPQLFSHQPDAGAATYFAKFPSGPGDGIELPDLSKLTDPRLSQDFIYGLMQDDVVARKNRLMDHILARFAETFVDPQYPDLAALYGLTDDEHVDETLLSLKRALLERYVVLSRDRNKGFNYTIPYAQSSYPFKTKLCLLLNIPLENEHSLSLTAPYKSLRCRDLTEDELRGDTPVGDLNRVRFKMTNHPQAYDHLVFYGSLRDSYRIEPVDNAYAILFHQPHHQQPVPLVTVDTKKSAEAVIGKLLQKFRTWNKQAEGFYVIEHILLRPQLEKQFDIELKVEGSRYVMTSVQSDYLEAQNDLLIDAVVYGTDPDRYLLAAEDTGWRVTLQDEEANGLLQVTEVFVTEWQALEAVNEKLVPYFRQLDRARPTLPATVQFPQVVESRREDFYDARLSLIFPRWIPRFADAQSKVLLRQSLNRCMPAHLGVTIGWFTMKAMVDFEQAYGAWLEHKARVAVRQPGILEHTLPRHRTGHRSKAVYRKRRRAVWNELLQLDERSHTLMEMIAHAEREQ